MSAAHPPRKESDTMLTYRQRAQSLAERISQEWQMRGEDDLKDLTDAVYHALVEEANLELRQILAQLGGQLELAHARASRGQPAFTPEKLEGLMGSVERASSLMEVFLDRASATKLTIRIDVEAFDLAEQLEGYVALNGMADRVRLDLQPAPVVADRQKLLDCLGHLLTRFYFAARPQEEVHVRVAAGDGVVEGFVGLSPSHLQPEQLIEEMRMPLRVEDIGIDVAYARAVVERHEGTLFVATLGETSVGFGFTLPMLPEGPA